MHGEGVLHCGGDGRGSGPAEELVSTEIDVDRGPWTTVRLVAGKSVATGADGNIGGGNRPVPKNN